jgi:selenocysteine lyase/cysteine desulfurase
MSESYFDQFRRNVVGHDAEFLSYDGVKKIIYADWIASGRMYEPIEAQLYKEIYPLVANTHTEANFTGTAMTLAYKHARSIIKKHVNASENDVLVSASSGMTGVVNKFQRILGLKIHEKFLKEITQKNEEKPVVFITHMEHHSNQTSWNETLAEVVIIPPDDKGLVDLKAFALLLEEHKHRPIMIAAITSCSNVTGIFTPYYEVAEMIHRYKGLCFVDFACSAPYIDIDMHPSHIKEGYLDAIYFSPHKFLGGPGSTGILIFSARLYNNTIPDDPGGGTVDYTNPWGESVYHDSIEDREDGGTPAFLQTMRAALAIKLKEEMQPPKILEREHELSEYAFQRFDKIKNLHLFASNIRERLGIFSFTIDGLHYNLGVRLLNDRYGIQVRGGCSCAGTYGHYLYEITHNRSEEIRNQIQIGDLSEKPGWIRMSIHPVMTDQEITNIMDAIEDMALNFKSYEKDYSYIPKFNDFKCNHPTKVNVGEWFQVKNWLNSSVV